MTREYSIWTEEDMALAMSYVERYIYYESLLRTQTAPIRDLERALLNLKSDSWARQIYLEPQIEDYEIITEVLENSIAVRKAELQDEN